MIYVKLKDYCSETGKAERTIRRMCAAGMIFAQKQGKGWLVGLDVVQRDAGSDDDCYECEDYCECSLDECKSGKKPPIEAPKNEVGYAVGDYATATTDDGYDVDCELIDEDPPEEEVIEVKIPVKIPVKLLLKVAGVEVG